MRERKIYRNTKTITSDKLTHQAPHKQAEIYELTNTKNTMSYRRVFCENKKKMKKKMFFSSKTTLNEICIESQFTYVV